MNDERTETLRRIDRLIKKLDRMRGQIETCARAVSSLEVDLEQLIEQLRGLGIDLPEGV